MAKLPRLTELEIKKIGETKLRIAVIGVVFTATTVLGGAFWHINGVSVKAGKTVEKVENIEKRVDKNETKIDANQKEIMHALTNISKAIGRLEGRNVRRGR